LPTDGRAVPTGLPWEVKHDGFRFICRLKLLLF
jgi:hypothetical protein